MKQTLDQALGPPSEVDFGGREVTEQTIAHLQDAFNASNPGLGQFSNTWNTQEDSQSDVSDLPAGAPNRSRRLWNQHGQSSFGTGTNGPTAFDMSNANSVQGSNLSRQDTSQPWGGSTIYPTHGAPGRLQSRVLSGPSISPYGFYCQPPSDASRYVQAPTPGPHRSLTSPTQGNRGHTLLPVPSTPWCQFGPGSPTDSGTKPPASPIGGSTEPIQSVGIQSMPFCHSRHTTTTLSPTAAEFTSSSTNGILWANPPVGIIITFHTELYSQVFRPVRVPYRRTSHHMNRSIIDVFLIRTSRVTGNT